jgi:hypothetical protein
MSPVERVDQQYLDFTAKTGTVFGAYPQIEPLRYFIFKQLLVNRKPMGWKGHVKHWLRPVLRRPHSRDPLGRTDVLLWIESYRKENIYALLPVYRELTSRGVNGRFVSFRGPDGLPPSTLKFEFPARALPPVWAKEAWQSLCDVVRELRHQSLRRSFYYECALIQGLFDEIDKILKATRPKVVIARGTQQPGETAFLVASRRHGALTLLTQHGIMTPLHIPISTDYMLTWGRSSNETLARLGVPQQRLLALGSPLHDSMGSSANGTARGALLRALSLPERPTFVFFSNGNDLVVNGRAPFECAQWLEATAAQYVNDLSIVVRLHPNEDGSLYRDCAHLHVTKNCPDLGTTLDGCDLVGSYCSTVLLEALLYKKPVWQFHRDDWPDLADNWRQNLAVRISSQAQLSEMVKRVLHREHENRSSDSLSRYAFANHGQATRAMADFILSRLGSRIQPPDLRSEL